ncbi:hypothetical protein JGE77_25750, partial [Salmonella enterica subsp. enterica serovar Typhimurium]|nr:hypothetical protein [Salmonella enterica subsp. enterica serovar Typhimurium]
DIESLNDVDVLVELESLTLVEPDIESLKLVDVETDTLPLIESDVESDVLVEFDPLMLDESLVDIESLSDALMLIESN